MSIADGNSVNISSINSIQSIIKDADGDTEIQVEESADEDIIRLNIGNQEALKISKNANSYPLFEVNSDIDTRATQFGLEAGISQTAAQSNNSFFGYQAGKATTSGTFNTGLGSKALSLNTIGERNVGIGAALAFNIDGDDNIGIGPNALGGNSNGNENVGIGGYTGFDNETGSNNVFIGYEAGRAFSPFPENVSDNVIIGHGAGQGNEGSGNVYIGKSVGLNSQLSNRLAIDNSDTNSPLLYGEFDNDLVRINGELNIKNEYSLPETDGTDGQVLTTDGAGNAFWGNSGVPVGSMMMWMTDTPPTGWVICNGQDITAFPKLVAVLGSNNAPDFRDKFPYGAGPFRSLGTSGGRESVTLSEANIPKHSHDAGTLKTTYSYKSNNSSAGSASNKDGSDVQFYNGNDITGDTGEWGGASNGLTQSFEIIPFYRTVNFIIKAE